MPRKKQHHEPEYRVRVFRDPASNQIAFAVETTKEFVNFHYELLLSDEREGKDIILKILGIHTPRSVMPGIGPARGFRRYKGLSGIIRTIVRNPDGAENTFKIKIRNSSVDLVEPPTNPFAVFSNEPVELPE